MKRGKKPIREQKKFLNSKGYEASYYLVVKNTSDSLTILNKKTGQAEEVRRD
jgi:hypothetical protein